MLLLCVLVVVCDCRWLRLLSFVCAVVVAVCRCCLLVVIVGGVACVCDCVCC